MKNTYLAIAGLIFAFTSVVCMNMDGADFVESESLYCSMVAQWDADAANGIPKGERAGWPPYDGRERCAKK